MKYIKNYVSLTESLDPNKDSYSIYLAGPDVFKGNAIEHFNLLKKIAKKYNHVGVSPFDNTYDLTQLGAATKIFYGNVGIMDSCDVIIANLEPFRGPNVDDGTAFEIGYGYAKGKLLYGYMEHSDVELKDITSWYGGGDEKFPHVEDFKYPRNLMLVDAIRKSGGNIFPTFEDCIKHLIKNK